MKDATMASAASDDDAAALRARILADPSLVLDDPQIMAALLTRQAGPEAEPADARRIVDLRAAQVARLERRLGGLRQAHDDLAETALEALIGLDQTHRSVLAVLDSRADPPETCGLAGLAWRVRRRLPAPLEAEEARLCLALDDDAPCKPRARRREGGGLLGWLRRRRTRDAATLRAEESLDPDLVLAPREILEVMTQGAVAPGRRSLAEASGAVLRRAIDRSDRLFFGAAAERLASVALVALDLGPRRSIGVLALGSADPERFRPGAPVELPALLGAVLERLIALEDSFEAERRGLAPGRPTPAAAPLKREPGS